MPTPDPRPSNIDRALDLVIIAVFSVALALLVTTGPADSIAESSIHSCETIGR